MSNNLKNLYNTLVSNGYTPPAYEQFVKDMQEEGNLRRVYSTLQSEGYTPPRFEQFKKDMNWTPISEQAKIDISADFDRTTSQLRQNLRRFEEEMGTKREYHDKATLGSGAVVDGGMKYNPNSGKVEKSYITPFGNRYMSEGVAEMESKRFRDNMTVNGQLRNANLKLAELKAKREERRQQVHKEAVADYESNTAPLATVLFTDTYVARQQGDTENSRLDVAIRQTEELIKDLEEQRDRERGVDVGFWRGFGRVAGDLRTWDFGLSDMRDAVTMINATEQEEGKESTAGEREAYNEMMSALQKKEQAEQVYGGNASFWNRAGVISGYMPSFMIDFAFTGGGFEGINLLAKGGSRLATKVVGKEVVEEMTKQGFKTYVKNNGIKGFGQYAGNWTIKALGTTGDDLLIRAPLMTNTVQMGKTTSDIIDRKLGNVVENEDGTYNFSNDKTWGSAIWQGEANAIIENYSEMFGGHLAPVATLGNMSKLANVVGAKRIGAVLSKADAGALSGIMGQTHQLFNKMGVSDYFGEVTEEYYGQMWRTMLNLDDAYQQNADGTRTNLLATGQFHGDIWGGMALSMGLMGAGKHTLTGAQYVSMKHGVNKADAHATELLGKEVWEPLRATIDLTTNDDIGSVAEGIVTDKDFTDDERAAVLTYMERSLMMRGFNLGTLAQKRGGEQDEDVQAMDESYIDGYNIETAQEMTDAKNMYEYQRERVSAIVDGDMLNLMDNSPAEALKEARHEDRYSADARASILDYLNAKQVYNGMIQRVRDDIDGRIDQSNAMVDARTNRTTGMIQGATMKQDDRRVYVVAGNLVQHADGSGIDTEASDETIIVRDAETGALEQVSPDAVLNIDKPLNPTDERMTAAEAIKERYIKEAADKVAGVATFQVGEVYNIDSGYRSNSSHSGEMIQVQVVANEEGIVDNGDGTVNVSDGVNIFPLAKETIQQQVDAANRARVERFDAERKSRGEARVEYELNDAVTLRDDKGNIIQGEISDYNEADDEFYIDVDFPIDGKYVVPLSRERLESMTIGHNGKEVKTGGAGIGNDRAKEAEADSHHSDNSGYKLEDEVAFEVDGVSMRGKVIEEADADGVLVEAEDGTVHKVKIENIKGEIEPEPIGVGRFGNIYDQFKRRAVDAVKFLFKKKGGEAKDVFYREEIGNVGLVWGDDKQGLQHIIQKHIITHSDFNSVGEMLSTIQDVIENGDITIQTSGNYRIEKDGKRAIIAKNENGDFVLTAYDSNRSIDEKKRSDADTTLFDQRVTDEMNGALVSSDIATESEVSENVGEKQNIEGNSQIEGETPSPLQGTSPEQGLRGELIIPTDEKGKKLYESAPVEATINDIYNDPELDEEEADAYVQVRIDGATKRIAQLEKKKPKMGEDIPAFKAEKAKWQANLEAEQASLAYWQGVQESVPEMRRRERAKRQMEADLAEQERERQARAEQARRAEERGRNRGDYRKAMAQWEDAPTSFHEYVAQALLGGDYKMRWDDNGSTRGLGSHTTGRRRTNRQGETVTSRGDEFKALSWLIDNNNGISPEALADRLWNDYTDSYGEDMAEGSPLDVVLDVVTSMPTPQMMWDYVKGEHDARMEAEQGAYEEQYSEEEMEAMERDALYREKYGVGEDEYWANEAQWDEFIESRQMSAEELEEYDNFVAEKRIREEYERRNKGNAEDEQRRDNSESERGVDVLQGKRFDNNRGDARVAGESQKADGNSVEPNDVAPKETINDEPPRNNILGSENSSRHRDGEQGISGNSTERERAEKGARRTDGRGRIGIASTKSGESLHQSQPERKGLEQNPDGGRETNGTGVADDATQEVLGASNRGDIRVFEDGLDTSYRAYSDDSERTRRTAESERLVAIAQKQGLFIPIAETKQFGEKILKRTGESVVYIDTEAGKVTKVKDPYAKSAMKSGVQPEDAAFEHLVHNLLFPETAYTLEGISEEMGDVRIVLSQDFIQYYDQPTKEQIAEALAARGLFPEDNYSFGNELVSVTDVEGDNVLLGEDGTVYFIDPIIRFKKPLREIIATLGGAEKQTPTIGEQVQAAEAEVNTTPTDKQKEAGNYKKGHVQIGTFNVTIEQPKGSVRSGVDANGKKWEVEMKNTYGYIRGTEGVDGDHIDVFLSDDIDGWNGRQVYVVDQRNEDGTFDEHKVMLGFNDINDAEAAYLSNYEEGWQGLGAITGVAIEDFEKWIASSHRKTKPFNEYKNVQISRKREIKARMEELKDLINEAHSRSDIFEEARLIAENNTLFEELKKLEGASAHLTNEASKANETAVSQESEQVSDQDNAPYSITPAQYTTKRGKVLDMHLVKFTGELRNTVTKLANSYAKQMKGWWDKSQGGFMMRNEEDAKRLAEYVADVQAQEPVTLEKVSMDDVKAVNDGNVLFTEPQQPTAESKEDEYRPVWQYSIHVDADGYTTLSRDDVSGVYPIGDARFRQSANSPEEMLEILRNPQNGMHMQEILEAVGVTLENKIKTRELDRKVKEEAVKEETNPSGNRFVTDERYAELRERMRKKLGGQMNIGIDPEILAIGTEMAVYHLEKGARKFTEYAKAMIADLGDAIRPYLKAFYNGARNLPEVESSEIAADMSSYDEVQTIDVANFDKPGIDALATAETVAREAEVEQEVEIAQGRIKKSRSPRKKSEKKAVNLQQSDELSLFDSLIDEPPTVGGTRQNERKLSSALVGTTVDNETNNEDGLQRTDAERSGRVSANGNRHEQGLSRGTETGSESEQQDSRGTDNGGERTGDAVDRTVRPRLSDTLTDQSIEGKRKKEVERNRKLADELKGVTLHLYDKLGGEREISGIVYYELANVFHCNDNESGPFQATRKELDAILKVARKSDGKDTFEPKNTHNNHSERGKDHAPTSVDARIEANIKAIELAKQLLESGEKATEKQMQTLRKFSGWGGLGKAFSEGTYYAPNNIAKKLRELLGDKAYQEAVMSANSAYYTPAYVVDTLWDIAEKMGFEGGNILEGSAGIGNILGQMPTHISERSNIHAIEIDGTSGGILSLLYPDANVEIQGFEQTHIANGSVDLAITNVPFVTGLRVNDTTGDKDLSKKFHNIHDFCIAKNVRKVREGGLGIFITSNGTLDNSKKLRDWIVNEGGADFVGAFRMHNKTWGGTGVTSDIIVIRKRVNGQKSANAIDVSTVTGERVTYYDTGEMRKKNGKATPVIKQLSMDYNRYFIEHPENMAGEMHFAFEKGDRFRPTSKGLYPKQDKKQEQMLAEWVQKFSGDYSNYSYNSSYSDSSNGFAEVMPGKKIGEMFVKDGKLYINSTASAQLLEVNANKVKGHTKVECFEAYTAIKEALAEVLAYQTENESDEGLKPLLDNLNRAYDDFVATYGHFNKNTAIAFLRNDVDYANVSSVETFEELGDGKGGVTRTFGLADVMKGRVVEKEKEKEPTPTNVKDGIIASIFKSGRVDIPYIAEQLGTGIEDVKKEIIESGYGFENPATRQIEASYQYLSGNVREKLRQAEANNENGVFDRNIKALQEVMPMEIPAHLIDFTLGSSWIDPKLYNEYVKERTEVAVQFTSVGGTWFMKEPYFTAYEKNRAMGVTSEMLGRTVMGHTLIEAAIQNRSVTVSTTKKNWDGSTETITDKEATQACAAKIDEIRQDFKDWARQKMQSDPEMSAVIERIYNDTFNNFVPMSIPDEFVPEYFGGASHKFKMRPHQGRAIVRGTQQPLLLAHEVGTGKTFTLISTAMEMRRLGTARKPMIVVQNATVGQFVASAKELYPNAKILTLEEADRSAEGRKNFYAKIRYNDWDMIVVPQSTFEFIPDSEEREMAFVQDKIEEKMLILEKMKEEDPDGKSMITRQAEREIELLEEQLAGISDKASKKRTANDEKKRAVALQNAEVKAMEMLDRRTDDVENFDDMGIDALLVDEAHEYKHLGFATAMQRGVKGVDPSYSKKSQGVFLKTQAVLEKNNGRNVIFATGTPISNTAAEIWTFMRYLMPADTMKEYGIYYFDDFVRNFGNIQQMLEFTTSGKFKENNRFAGYVNLPELVRIWSGVSDTVLTKEAGGVSDKIPEMEGGKAQDLYLPQTRALRGIMKFVKGELEKYDKMSGKEKKENSHIPLTMYGITKAAAVDARLVQADAEDDEHSKTNEAVRQTLRSLQDTADYKGTVAIFADNYQNKHSGFNIYDDIRDKLIAEGVPADEIVVMRSGMTVKKKLEIFEKVNRGEVRVILGSTFTLGTGVNIQERLHTLIHLDAPNRPMDYTQRNGRILRQGNLHKAMGKPVRILRFGVEDSLDVTAYQRLKTKGAIADSIMNGKQMMSNSMTNRVLEEEEDVFGDTVAQLSGSEYAMLKNNAEKNMRKYASRKKQYEADQTYIHNAKPRVKAFIKDAEKRIEDNSRYLEAVRSSFPDGKFKEIVIGKHRFTSVEAMEDLASPNHLTLDRLSELNGTRSIDDFFKGHNKSVLAEMKQMKDGDIAGEQKRELTIQIGDFANNATSAALSKSGTSSDLHSLARGFSFVVTTKLTRQTMRDGATLFNDVDRKMTYSCAELGIEDIPVRQNLLRNAIEDITHNVITGRDFAERLEAAQRSKKHNEAELEQLLSREGKPFEYEEELAQAKAQFEEYAELMKKELAEKEAKYAEIDGEIESGELRVESATEEDSDVLYRSDELKDLIEDTFNQAISGEFKGKPISIGRLTNEGKAYLEQISGISFRERVDFVLNPSDLVHIYKDHFGNNEKDKGQNIPLDIEDIRSLADVITMPDKVVFFKEGEGSNRNMFYFFKEAENGTYNLMEIYSDRKGNLTAKTFYKTRKDASQRVMDIGKSLLPTSETYFGAILSDAKIPQMFETTSIEDNYSRDGEGAYTDDEVSFENDPISKVLGKPRGTRKQRREFAQRERRRMVERVESLAKRLHLDNVEIVTDASTLEGKKQRAKGFYSKSTGKITIVIPNHTSTFDVEQTLLHEAVAHYGLRELFGGHFDTFLDNVFNNADETIRRRIVALATKNGWDFRKATEEYLAMLAENTEFENTNASWWRQIKDFFLNMLHKIGFEDLTGSNHLTLDQTNKFDGSRSTDGFRGVTLTDNELRYILWRSYENLAEPGRYRSVLGEAADVAMQYELKVGNYAVADSHTPTAAEDDILYRDGDPEMHERELARHRYERRVKSGMFQTQEALQDSMLGLREAMSAILGQGTNIEEVDGFENAYLGENRLSSVNKAEADAFARLLFKPMLDEVAKLARNEAEREELTDYMMAKHGLERNRIMAERDAKRTTDEAVKEIENSLDKELNKYQKANELFNQQLQDFESNSHEGNLLLGEPSPILEACGIDVSSVFITPKTLKAHLDKHGLTINDIKDLPKALQSPLMVYEWGTTARSMVVITHIPRGEQHITIAIKLERGGKRVEVNEIASIHGKDSARFINEMIKSRRGGLSSGLKYVDKENALNWLGIVPPKGTAPQTQQERIANIIEKFENPTTKIQKIQDEIKLEKAKFNGVSKNLPLSEANKWYDTRKKTLDSLLQNGKISSIEYGERIHKLNTIFNGGYLAENREGDYSGLTALTGMDNVAEAEAEAQRMVDDYEQAHETDALWDKVNAVSKAILQKSYKCGMMSKETFDKISDMYEFYIPLRGFDEKTSNEAYAYLTHKHSAFNAPIKKAEGRRSKADDPFANLQSMAESAIMQGNRNKLVKQRFLNFVLNHPSDLVSVSDLWVEYDAVTDEWKPVFPDNIDSTDTPEEVEQKMQDFETKMEQLAQQYPDQYKRGKDAVNIPYRIVESRDMRQHQVVVKRGGRDYVITINGNPRAAQALNGQTNPDNDMSGAIGAILRAGEKINRQLNAFYTTRNPDFIVSNFMRDMLYTNTMTWIKESPNYALRFHRNYAKVNPVTMKRLLARYRKGTLDMSDKTEGMFYLFMMNGGETGYANIRDIEQHKNDIRKELKRANGKLKIGKALSLLAERFDELNRAVENCARFAAFITSREMGRSIDRAIYDAKEISVNFNKKGSGAKFYDSTGQTKAGNASALVSGLGRSGYVFWNAAIQGTTNFGRQMKRHPAKAFTGVAAMFLLGAIIAYLGGDDDEDDKNAYYNLPEYVRRSNILFRAGDSWISIPLPIEYRAFYGMGELMTSIFSGKEHLTGGEIAEAIAGQATQILPIDFLEGGGGLNAFVPSAAKPLWEAYVAEKSWTGMPLYKDTPWNKDMPEWTKAYKSTNKHIVNLAATLNDATGGDRYTKGTIDLNPANIEYMLNGYFGGVFGTIDKLSKTAETIEGDREYDPRSILLVNRLVKAGDERTEYRAVNNEYFRLKKEAENTKRRLRAYENDTNKGIFDYAEKIDFLYNSPEYGRYLIYENYRQHIDFLGKAVKRAEETGDKAEIKQAETELNEAKKEMINKMYDNGIEGEDKDAS